MQRGGLFTGEQAKILVHAIAEAEAHNRGEVRVHVERRCPHADPLERAAEVFVALGMNETEDDTGVLLYVAVEDRSCAVFAGEGVLGARAEGFWQGVADAVANGYRRNDPVAGIEMALLRIGALLREHAPGEDAAGDELSNAVTSGAL